MKKTFIYLFILLCFACRNKQEYTLCGTLYMDSNTVVDMLGIQMEDTLLYVKVDSAGYFSTTIPFREVVFCNLFGVAVTGEERWQFVTPVALQANASVDLDFHLTGGQTSIGATDPDNRALQAFREWSLNQSRTLWSNPPAGTELASRLARFPCEVQRITERERLDSTTAGYLSAWANIECLNLAHGLFRDSIPAALASALPVISQALDVPYWKLLYGSDLYISEYLEQNARLDKLCSDRPDKEQLIRKFRDKRYASPGAPLPDAVFEDKNGQEHRLTEFAGKYIYIDLWASWCAPCVAEVPHLQKLEKDLNRRDIVFVSISLDTKRENWEKQMEQLHMHGNQWLVRDEAFADMMNVKGIPHFLLYGKDGTLLDYKTARPSSGDLLKSRLEHLP